MVGLQGIDRGQSRAGPAGDVRMAARVDRDRRTGRCGRCRRTSHRPATRRARSWPPPRRPNAPGCAVGWNTQGVVGNSGRTTAPVTYTAPARSTARARGLEESLELEPVEKARVVGGDGVDDRVKSCFPGGPGREWGAEGRDVHVAGLIDGDAARPDIAIAPDRRREEDRARGVELGDVGADLSPGRRCSGDKSAPSSPSSTPRARSSSRHRSGAIGHVCPGGIAVDERRQHVRHGLASLWRLPADPARSAPPATLRAVVEAIAADYSRFLYVVAVPDYPSSPALSPSTGPAPCT